MSIKFKELLYEIRRDEYVSLISENKNDTFKNLSYVFYNFNKFTGNLNEDKNYLENFIFLIEQEEEDFDPFSHLEKTEKIDVEKDCVLTFSGRNKKIDIPYFSLPASYTCPFADVCKTFVPRDREKIDDRLIQDKGDIRCFAASTEAIYPNVQKSRWTNKDLLDKTNNKTDLILKSLFYFEKKDGRVTVLRVHESGDFYNQDYFDAWMEVARQRTDITFYAYTKSLRYWIHRLGSIPNNFKLIASVGGKNDELIEKYDLRYVKIVNSPEEAKNLKLRIDVDDTIAYGSDENFALLIHGQQKAGTEQSKYAYKNRKILKKYKNK